MFNPALCIYEVWKVAETRRTTDYPSCDIGTAFSMFFSDVKQGAAHPENTGDILPDFDFAAAKVAWDAMTSDEQTIALEEARMSRTTMANELAASYPDKEAMIKIVEDFLIKYRAEQAAEAEEEQEAAE